MISTYQGSVVMNVFHYVNEGGAILEADGENELLTLIDNFKLAAWDAAGADWKSLVVGDFLLKEIRAQVVRSTRKYYVSRIILENGGAVGDGIPSDTHMSITTRVALIGRGHTGNKKITGLSVGSFDGAYFTLASRVAFNTVAQSFLVKLNDVGAAPRWRPIVWSQLNPSVTNPIIQAYPQPTVRVLRRRQIFLGQ